MNRFDDFFSSNSPKGKASADLVLINGRIYTVDSDSPWAEAVAIKNGRFCAVGKSAAVSELADGDTTVIDLNGRFAMPGLYDMHTHPDLALGPRYAGYLDVGIENPTPDQIKAAILDYAASRPGDGWVYGSHFVRYTFRKAGLEPGQAWLDTIMPDRPVAILDRMWGTMMANSRALEAAGITADTPDPRNGYLERDSITGQPTGMLIDGAYALIHAAMPPTPDDALQKAYLDGIHYQSAHGVVGTKYVHVCERRLDALKRIDDAGRLTLRTEAAISWQDDIFPVKRRWQLLSGERHYYRSSRLSANAVKFHFDGTVEPRSSFLLTPWSDDSSWRGKLNLTPEHITAMLVDMDRRGIRVIAHCTGDAASDIFLDAVAEARRINGMPGVRHQCAHSSILHENNLKRFHDLNVTAEFSPVAWFPSKYLSGARTGYRQDRLERAYNINGVLAEGGNAVIGTDWPVSHINPWIGMETLVTRENPWGEEDGRFYGEPITIPEAIEVMTLNGARAMEIDDYAGSISVGKSADIIVIDRDLFDLEPLGNIHDTQVLATLVEGEVVYDAPGLFVDAGQSPVWQSPPPDL